MAVFFDSDEDDDDYPYDDLSPSESAYKKELTAYRAAKRKRSLAAREQARQTQQRLQEQQMGIGTWNDNFGLYTKSPVYVASYDAFDAAKAFTKIASTAPKSVVPSDATYFGQCRYGGNCHTCNRYISVGEPIWWRRTGSRSRIWCGDHKHAPANPAVGEEHDTEDDMAQRFDFKFPYTGGEIAAALEVKASKLDAQQVDNVSIDRDTAKLLGYSSDEQYDALVKSKTKEIEKANEKLAKEAAALRKEAIPYAKAGKQSFDIDAEDIEHFGLDDEEPAPRQRRRAPRKPSQPVEEAVSA